jgi:hypothetical protein
MDMNNTNNRVIAVIVFIILLIGAWYLGRAQGAALASGTMMNSSAAMALSNASSSDTGATTSSAEASGASVSVADQTAGKTVAINSVTLGKVGWVAIREKRGRILGAERFNAGTSNRGVVSLLRATVAGQHYDVVLYIDNGDKAFDLHKDIVVKNAEGSDVAASFNAM